MSVFPLQANGNESNDSDDDVEMPNVVRNPISCKLSVVEGLPLNPSAKKNIEPILEKLRDLCEKRGQKFVLAVMDGSPHKAMIDIICEAEKRGKLEDILTINGLFHSTKEFTMIFLTEIVRNFDVGLLNALGFESDGHVDWICATSDFHKSFEVVEVMEYCLGVEITLKVMEKNNNFMVVSSKDFWSYVRNDGKTEGGFVGFLYMFAFALVQLKDGIRKANWKKIKGMLQILDLLLYLSPREFYSKIRAFEEFRERIFEITERESLNSLLRDVALHINNDQQTFEGMDAKMEALNKWLKRIVKNNSAEEWLRKSILFPHLMFVRKLIFDWYDLQEDKRTTRAVFSKVIDTVFLRARIRQKFEFIDSTSFRMKKIKSKKDDDEEEEEEEVLLEGHSADSLRKILIKRMNDFGIHFIDSFLKGKGISLTHDFAPVIYFSQGRRRQNEEIFSDVLVNVIEDSRQSSPSCQEVQSDSNNDNVETNNSISDEANDDLVLISRNNSELHEYYVDKKTGKYESYLKQGHQDKVVDFERRYLCCENEHLVTCGKRIDFYYGVGKCVLCNSFFVETTGCGVVIKIEDEENDKSLRQYCKYCVLNSNRSDMRCVCGVAFTEEDINIDNVDICDGCFSHLLHPHHGRSCVVTTPTSKGEYSFVNLCNKCSEEKEKLRKKKYKVVFEQ